MSVGRSQGSEILPPSYTVDYGLRYFCVEPGILRMINSKQPGIMELRGQ